jgi:hypothetical protein
MLSIQEFFIQGLLKSVLDDVLWLIKLVLTSLISAIGTVI